MLTWITRLSGGIAVSAAVASPTETLVSGLRGCLLAHTGVVARVFGASLASRDANAVRLITDEIDDFLAEHQSTNTTDEASVNIGLWVYRIEVRNSTDVERLPEI